MIEAVLQRDNLNQAYRKVVSNAGGSGVDGVTIHDLHHYAHAHKAEALHAIRNRNYIPKPIRGVEIPKSNGKKRLLGIPTCFDRLLQQALTQVLTPLYEPEFLDTSYGFRPGKNAHDAVHKSLEYLHSGKTYVVDIDLKSFFDEVSHEMILQLLYKKVKCDSTLLLIKRYLRAPIQINGRLHKRRRGLPQGGPLSPLLSNILLHELDKELTSRRLNFVRYADDFSIYVSSKEAAKRVGNGIYLYLKYKLKLRINRVKSGIRRPKDFKMLGYGFVPLYKKGVKGRYQLVVDVSKWKVLKQQLKYWTRKTQPLSFDERIIRLRKLTVGWLNYFKYANMSIRLKKLDHWLRNRLRYCIWHDWKKPERKRKNLIRLGISPDQAYAWSRTNMGGWRVAQSPILITTITLNRLKQRGYQPLQELHAAMKLG